MDSPLVSSLQLFRPSDIAGLSGASRAWLRKLELAQKRTAVDLDVLPGNEGRPRAAQETHDGRNIRRLPAPANERAHQRMMLRHRLSRWARRRHQAWRHCVHPDLIGRELVRQ